MNLALLTVLLAVIWVAITGNSTAPNMVLGLVLAMLAVLLLRGSAARPRSLRRAARVVSLAWLFLRELLVSAIRVALIVMSPSVRSTLRPAIVAFPLTIKSDAEITLLANLITLTPGTLSVDVAEDRSVLYVHVLTLKTREQLIAEIAGGFEAKVREVYA